MLSRRLISAAAPTVKSAFGLNAPVTTAVIRREAHHGPPAHYKHPTMDELAIPCGSWQENHDNYQRKYNIHLLLGVGFFLITFIANAYSGTLNLYLLAPEKPGPRKSP